MMKILRKRDQDNEDWKWGTKILRKWWSENWETENNKT